MRRIAALIVAAIFVVASAALASATGWGGNHDGDNPKYHPSPCFWWSWDRDKDDDWKQWGDRDWDRWENDYKAILSDHNPDKKCIPFPCKLEQAWDSKHGKWMWKWACDKPEPPNCRSVKIYNSKDKKWERIKVCDHPKPDCERKRSRETCHYPLPRDCKTGKSCSRPYAESKKEKVYDSKSRSWSDKETWTYRYQDEFRATRDGRGSKRRWVTRKCTALTKASTRFTRSTTARAEC